MNPQEVRLGNIVSYKGKQYQIAQINYNWAFLDYGIEMRAVRWHDLEPVPITKEELEKYNMYHEVELDRGEAYVEHLVGKYLNEKYEPWFYIIEPFRHDTSGGWIYSDVKVEFMHQVQNIHFSLTGKELTAKQ